MDALKETGNERRGLQLATVNGASVRRADEAEGGVSEAGGIEQDSGPVQCHRLWGETARVILHVVVVVDRGSR